MHPVHPLPIGDRDDRTRGSCLRRATRVAVRNPMLALPAVLALTQLDQDVRATLRAILLDLARDARGRAEQSWRRHKAPMAAYWKAVAVYAGHLARVLR